MKYTEELAKQVAAEHKVSVATISTWKHRGTIPDKYLRKNYSKTTELTDEYLKLAKKVLTILSLKEINASVYVPLMSYSSKISEVKAQKSQFTSKEIDAVVLKVKELRLEISKLLRDDRKFLDKYFEKQIAILQRPEVVVTHTLNLGGITKDEYTIIRGILDKRSSRSPDSKIIDKITDALHKLYILVNV